MTTKQTLPFDLTELERLAKAATPGPWFLKAGSIPLEICISNSRYIAEVSKLGNRNARENFHFIAAANPATILCLLGQISALQDEVERLRPAQQSTQEGSGN